MAIMFNDACFLGTELGDTISNFFGSSATKIDVDTILGTEKEAEKEAVMEENSEEETDESKRTDSTTEPPPVEVTTAFHLFIYLHYTFRIQGAVTTNNNSSTLITVITNNAKILRQNFIVR